jgi:hypothetical protein
LFVEREIFLPWSGGGWFRRKFIVSGAVGNLGAGVAGSSPVGGGISELVRRRLLGELASPVAAPELVRAELLHQIFEAQADLRGEEIALMCGDERMSYGELEQKANQLARWLRRHGAKAGASVAFLLPRSMDVIVTLLAVLKSGAAYVPLDPDYPADRVAFILADSGARAVVTVASLAATCSRKGSGKFRRRRRRDWRRRRQARGRRIFVT